LVEEITAEAVVGAAVTPLHSVGAGPWTTDPWTTKLEMVMLDPWMLPEAMLQWLHPGTHPTQVEE